MITNTNKITNTITNTNTVLEHDPTIKAQQELSERDTNVHLNAEAQMFFRNK